MRVGEVWLEGDGPLQRRDRGIDVAGLNQRNAQQMPRIRVCVAQGEALPVKRRRCCCIARLMACEPLPEQVGGHAHQRLNASGSVTGGACALM